MKTQQAAGTDSRPFLVLSSYFFQTADLGERQFVVGRLVGHVAASQVTATSLYGLLVDHAGVRQVARRAVGPVLEVVLAPMGLGIRLAMSRWHRAAELTADRAGLLCCRSVDDARRAMLRISLSIRPELDPEVYLDQLRDTADGTSPGRWAELLASEPWMHKRMRHLQWFAESALYAELTDRPTAGKLSRDELERRSNDLLGVS
jgi:Zn-dependent protease with chaperone function